MAKKKRPARKGRAKFPPTPPSDRREVGLQAFRAGRLDDAIVAWTELAADDAQVAAALTVTVLDLEAAARSGEQAGIAERSDVLLDLLYEAEET